MSRGIFKEVCSAEAFGGKGKYLLILYFKRKDYITPDYADTRVIGHLLQQASISTLITKQVG